MKALIIDHDDSFTQNLKHWLKPLFAEIQILNHSHFLDSAKIQDIENHIENDFDLLVLSPGPKNPQHYPHILNLLNNLKSGFPVYGVCLGLQMIAISNNEEITTYSPPLHGKTSELERLSSEYKNFQNLKVARYHSIRMRPKPESEFHIVACSADDQTPMWIKHKSKKQMAVQFHPESFLTEKSELHLEALKKWLDS